MKAENTSRSFTVIDLFSGAGGTAVGFHQAGFKIAGAIDIDLMATKTYEHNLGVKPVVADLLELPPQNLLKLFDLKPKELDVLVGCPPCQGFTRMRSSKGEDDERNSLVLRYLEFVDVLRPKFVVFENVPGIIRTKHGKEFFKALENGLDKLDYTIRSEEIDAADFGVPQHRKRVVLIGSRDSKDVPYPKPTHASPNSEEVRLGKKKRWKTVGDALGELPAIESGQSHEEIPNHVARRMGDRVSSFIKMVPKDGGSRKDVDYEYWLPCHKKKNSGHQDVYGRLSLDKPAGVMTSGCTNVSKGRFVHPTQDRGISFREAAELQSFPSGFLFHGNMAQVDRQIGNAVPPKLAKAIAIELRKAIERS